MSAATQVYFEPDEIKDRLSQLGLTREAFISAADQSLAAFLSCTESHPPTFPGTAAWAEANRSLRDNLFALGWTRKNETNQPLVVNSAETMAITSCSGDDHTGRRGEFPSTRSSKGARTKDYIRRNQESFEFMDDPTPIVASTKVAGRATWLFLIFRDMKVGEMRYELSLPTSMGEDGHVDDWAERLIFPATLFDVTELSSDEDDGGQSPEITVEIRKLG
jgi:hypothetical protein